MNRATRALSMAWALVWLTSACVSEQSKPDVKLDVASEVNKQLAIDYLVKRNLPAAKEKIDRALEQNPRNASAHGIAGLLYDQLGESSKADGHFQKALSLDGKDPDIMNNYAAFLCNSGRYDRGEKYALQAGGNPLYKTPELAFMNAGICQRQAGNLSRAEEHYRRALGIRPKFAGALFEMAELELQQANYMPARAFLERYLEVSKTSPATLWLGVRIERGLGNKTGANNYAARLKNEYPTAVETKELLESERTMK